MNKPLYIDSGITLNDEPIKHGTVLRSNHYPYHSESNDNYYAYVHWDNALAAFMCTTVKHPKANIRGISSGNCNYLCEELAQYDYEFEIVHDTEIVETITKIANRWGYGT